MKKRQPTIFSSQKAKGKAKVIIFNDHKSKEPTSTYSSKCGHVKAKCKEEYEVLLGVKRWTLEGNIDDRLVRKQWNPHDDSPCEN